MALKNITGSLNTSVGIATYYGLEDRGSIFGRRRKFFSSPQRSDRLWGPPSLLSSRFVKQTTHRNLVPISRMVELYLHSRIRFHDVLLNEVQGQLYSKTQ
jgi:hypothetical protein